MADHGDAVFSGKEQARLEDEDVLFRAADPRPFKESGVSMTCPAARIERVDRFSPFHVRAQGGQDGIDVSAAERVVQPVNHLHSGGRDRVHARGVRINLAGDCSLSVRVAGSIPTPARDCRRPLRIRRRISVSMWP